MSNTLEIIHFEVEKGVESLQCPSCGEVNELAVYVYPNQITLDCEECGWVANAPREEKPEVKDVVPTDHPGRN